MKIDAGGLDQSFILYSNFVERKSLYKSLFGSSVKLIWPGTLARLWDHLNTIEHFPVQLVSNRMDDKSV